WSGGVRLGSRWRAGELVVDGEHRPLPADLPPGGSLIVPLPLIPPAAGPWTLEVALRFGGRIGLPSELAAVERLIVPIELVREGRRRPLVQLVRSAQKLGIPVVTTAGEPLGRRSIVRRKT